MPCGFSTFKQGDLITLLYWIEGKNVRYSMQIQGNGNIDNGYLEIDEISIFHMKSVPNGENIYAPGEVFEKWSTNERMTSSGMVEELQAGEIGLCIISNSDKNKLGKMVIAPNKSNSGF